MKKNKKEFTRRDFLRATTGAILAGSAGISVLAQEAQRPGNLLETSGTLQTTKQSAAKSKVILVRNEKVLDSTRKIDATILDKMLDDAVMALFGEKNPKAAWKKIISPSDIVGVKSNHWRFLPTPPELEQVIKHRLIEAGVKETNISIDDRGVLSDPIFQKATALINTRPMRTHHWAGVGSLLKNYIMFSPSPPSWHDDSCANLAGLWDLPAVKGKTRLNILVMLTPLFNSKGPHDYQESYVWNYKGLIVGTDPVACDATGVRILEAKRRAVFGEDVPFTVSPKHVRVAEEKFKLGIADAARIDVQKLGWKDDILI